MTSVKAIATCLFFGAESPLPVPAPLPEPFSLVRDFFGYRAKGYSGPLSVKQQIDLVQGRHVHLNLIRVGNENFTAANDRTIDRAVEVMRQIYGTVGLGVGRVLWFFIPEADANDSLIFQSIMAVNGIAEPLTNAWTVHNIGLDVFIVLQFDPVPGGVIGLSPVGGTCDKDDSCEMTGTVICLETGPLTGQLLGHEAGHYLGLGHINGLSAEAVDLNNDGVIDPGIPASAITNLMFPMNTATSNTLTPIQGGLMAVHCFTGPGC